MRDAQSGLDIAQSLAPSARNATANGAEVDLANFDSATAVIDSGAWTDGTHTFEVQESDTSGSGFTAVAAADLIGAEPVIDGTPDHNQVYKIGYIGSKRYLRVVQTVSGATTGLVSGASVVRGNPRKQ